MAVAKINKDMMYWARKYAGYVNGYENELPKDIKEKYESWEAGDKFPTWIQLRKVSKKYKVPTAFFFMKTPPEYNNIPTLVNYRKLDMESIYENNSPFLIDNIHTSEYRRRIFIELSEDMRENIPSFEKFDGEINKYNLSSFIREKLDISLTTQKSWLKKDNRKDKNHYNFLNNWKEAITEKMGVLIFESYDVDIKEMRGLCIYHDNVPIILLNGKDSVNGRIFSLFHELTHLLLGESAICGDDLERDIEVFCNAVSGEFLVPEKDLTNNLHNIPFDDLLKELSDLYGVSNHVILRRLLDLNKITKKDYDLKTDYDEFIPSSNSKGNRGNYYRNMIKYNGKPFYSLVISAYELNLINGSDFSKFTGLKINQAPIIEEMIYWGRTMRKFVIDTSSLIDLEKYYPYNVFPSLWNFLFELFDEEKLFSVNEAYEELKDSQEVWKDYKNCFRDLTEEESEYLSEIMILDKFEPFRRRGFEKTNGGPWADPYLIACGIADNNITVVSQESSRKHPHSVIPYVCGEYNVPCIKFLDFLRENNFKI